MLWAGRVRPSSWVRHGRGECQAWWLGAAILWRLWLTKSGMPQPYFYPPIHGHGMDPHLAQFGHKKGPRSAGSGPPFFARIWAPQTPQTGPLIIRQIGENSPTPLQLWCFLVDVFLKKSYPPGTPLFRPKRHIQKSSKAVRNLGQDSSPISSLFSQSLKK